MHVYKYAQTTHFEGGRPVEPVRPISDVSPPRSGADPFGAAYVREQSAANGLENFTVYTAEARMADLPAHRAKGTDGKELSESDEALLEKLKARDAKVRSHEAAHVTAAGGQASHPTYSYQTGPDGKRYAIGGSVNISVMTTGEGEADARRAKKAYRAAMATGEPSARDMQTAAKAQSMSTRSMREAAERYAARPGTGILNEKRGNAPLFIVLSMRRFPRPSDSVRAASAHEG